MTAALRPAERPCDLDDDDLAARRDGELVGAEHLRHVVHAATDRVVSRRDEVANRERLGHFTGADALTTDGRHHSTTLTLHAVHLAVLRHDLPPERETFRVT